MPGVSHVREHVGPLGENSRPQYGVSPGPRAQAGLLYPLGHHFGARGCQEPRVFESPPGRHKDGEMAVLAIVIPFRFLSCEYVSQPPPRLATLRRPRGLLWGLSIKG